jgi:hypothetical protein
VLTYLAAGIAGITSRRRHGLKTHRQAEAGQLTTS